MDQGELFGVVCPEPNQQQPIINTIKLLPRNHIFPEIEARNPELIDQRSKFLQQLRNRIRRHLPQKQLFKNLLKLQKRRLINRKLPFCIVVDRVILCPRVLVVLGPALLDSQRLSWVLEIRVKEITKIARLILYTGIF